MFTIHGRSDLDYATNPDDHRSISSGRVFVNEAPISFCSAMQKFVILSVTEAKMQHAAFARFGGCWAMKFGWFRWVPWRRK